MPCLLGSVMFDAGMAVPLVRFAASIMLVLTDNLSQRV